METIMDAQQELIIVVKNLIGKVKSLKEENSQLKSQLHIAEQNSAKTANALILTTEQKMQIEALLQETKTILTS